MKTAELLLPEAVRRKAAVSVGGEHAWHVGPLAATAKSRARVVVANAVRIFRVGIQRNTTGRGLRAARRNPVFVGKTLDVDEGALELLVTQGHSLAFGARFLKRVIDERIKLPITEQWREDSHFVVRVVRGELTVMTSAAGIRDSSAV